LTLACACVQQIAQRSKETPGLLTPASAQEATKTEEADQSLALHKGVQFSEGGLCPRYSNQSISGDLPAKRDSF